RGLRVLRVYDEQDRLLAGEWARDDGTSTVYRAGLAPQETATNATTQGSPATETSDDAQASAAQASQSIKAALAAGDFWRLEPSARTFNALVGDASRLTVEEGVGSYVLAFRDDVAGSTNDDAKGDGAGVNTISLVAATLRLSKADLRATEQTLVVRRGGETRELRFVEGGFERRRAEEVAPRVFEPEPALLGGAGSSNESDETVVQPESRPAEGTAAQPSSPGTSAPPAAASAELEIEVTYLLNQIKADLGEQVGLTRTAAGLLRVEALVESEGRKQEILRALGPVLNNPSVSVEVSTVAEAARRERRQRDSSEGVREVEVEDGRFAAEAELRKYFSARLVGEARIQQEMERFAARAMGRSRQALLHANALRRLASRFTPEETRSLAPEARTRWLSMVREHARAYRRETAALRAELRPVFGGSATGGDDAGAAQPSQAAEQLLRLSYATDEAVRSALAASEHAGASHTLGSAQFWRSLQRAEQLAAAIEEGYRD
ncbi:MAG TPA: hypothetical protein VGV38_08325, partial [Pyrinomonadaceae bacterium]|nr:hypothetical protein [Pyrinomonadaceae bacterium]